MGYSPWGAKSQTRLGALAHAHQVTAALWWRGAPSESSLELPGTIKGAPGPAGLTEGRAQLGRCPCSHDRLEGLEPLSSGAAGREGPLPSCVFALEQVTLPLSASPFLSVKWV